MFWVTCYSTFWREPHSDYFDSARNDKEKVLIEATFNSVRISILIKQADDLEEILVDKFSRVLMQRAEKFSILRRKPVEGYTISFLITNTHTEGRYLTIRCPVFGNKDPELRGMN